MRGSNYVPAGRPLADQVEPQKVQLECDPDSKASIQKAILFRF